MKIDKATLKVLDRVTHCRASALEIKRWVYAHI